MAKKDRPDPFSEGSVSEIYRHFFGPLIRYKPSTMPIKDWLEHLFDLKNRDITRYKVEKAFTMPGHFMAAPLLKVQGIGYRQVKPGTILYVRKDARKPFEVEVEFLGGVGSKDQVFTLTDLEWTRISRHCKEAERKRNQ